MNQTLATKQASNPYMVVLLISAGLLLLRFVPYLLPESRLWGINHLLYLPAGYSVAYAIFGVLSLAVLTPLVQPYCERWFGKIARLLLEQPRLVLWAVLSFLAVALFWALRIPTFFLGDGYYVINNIGNDLPVVFKWSEEAAVQVVFFVSKLLPFTGPKRGEYAYAIVSVISGGITLYNFHLIVRELAGDGYRRLFGILMLLFSGWTLLFFGYAENYPVLWPLMTAYIYSAIRYITGNGRLYMPTILLAVALALHLQALFFLISYPVLFFSGDLGRGLYRKYRGLILWLTGIIAICGIVLFAYLYRTSLDFRIHFLPLWSGRPARPDYALLTPKHLTDIANLLTLLAPAGVILLILAWKQIRSSSANPIGRFLLAFSAGGFLFLFLIDPKLGLARDWDLYALTGLGPVLFLFYTLSKDDHRSRKLLPGLAGLALVMTIPYLAVNQSTQPSIDRYVSIMRTDPETSRGGLVVLRSYYYAVGDTARAEAIDRKIWEAFPAVRMVRRATDLSRVGRADEALALADSVLKIDPFAKEAYNLRGMIYLRARNYQRAIADLEQAARLGQYDARIMVNLAQAYFVAGDQKRMMATLRKAQRLDPHLSFVIDALATAFYSQKIYDSALVYGRQLTEADTSLFGGYKIAGFAADQLGDSAAAIAYLRRFLQLNPLDAEADTARAILRRYESGR